MQRTWPLTGRDDELAEIARAVGLRPGPRGIVLAGPAGVGKTRLAREAVGSARRSPVLWVHASAAARRFPLGAFSGTPAPSEQHAERVVSRTITDLRLAGHVVVVDDAHLLDDLSAVVIHRLVSDALATVVLTLRDGEPAPDVVTALWKDDLLPRLDVAPLSQEDTAQLLTRVLGGPVESASARRLWALTQGSPLFLRHLLESEVGSGRLAAAAGVWCWEDVPEVSHRLATIVREQIGDLAAEVRDVLDLVALAEPLPLQALTRLTADSAVEEAEGRRLVQLDRTPDGAAVRLGHPMYGEVRRAEMGVARARRLRGLVAMTLPEERSLVARATLALDSDLPPDAGLFLRAAQSAIALADVRLAERLAAAAVRGGAGADGRLLHASALSWLSRGPEADAVLRDLAATAPDRGLRDLATAFRVGNLFWTMRRPGEAQAVLHAALAGTDGLPSEHPDLLMALRSSLDASLGHGREALRRAHELRAPGGQHPLAVALHASAVAAGAAVLGRMDLLDDAAAAADRAGGGGGAMILRFGLGDWHVLGLRLAGRPMDAGRVSAAVRSAGDDLPGPPRLMGLVVTGHAELAAGRPATAVRVLREAWAGLGPSAHEFRFRCRVLLTTACALTGDLSTARRLLPDVERDQHPAYTLLRPDDLLARAWVLAAEGATSTAGSAARAAAALARSQGSPAYEVLAWQTAVQLGDPTGAVDRLARLSVLLGSPRADLALAYAAALVAGDGDALDAVSGRWEALGDLVAAGDAAAHAAATHRSHGRHGSAVAAAATAHRLAQVSGARTPALAVAAAPLPLTAREREVAVLAARGMSNRVIAERLLVSVRTVEGHVYRAGHKLGISHREGFAAVVGVEPLTSPRR